MEEVSSQTKRKFLVNRLNGEVDELSNYNFFTTMIQDYHNGQTYRQLAQEYQVAKLFDIEHKCEDPLEMAEAIVGEAIRRYDPNKEQHRGIAKERSLANLVSGHGVHFSELTPDERIKLSKKGVEARGRITMTKYEKQRIQELAQKPDYQTPRGINCKMISEQINQENHNGDPVRTPSSIRSYLYKANKNNPQLQ